MKPVLAAWSQKRRNVLFGPIVLGIFFVLFLILGFSLNDVFLPLLIATPIAVAAGWLLLGWPLITNKDGSPLIPPKVKPFLVFPGAIAFAAILYTVFGVLFTKLSVPPKFLAPASLVLAAIAGSAIAYLIFGFPHVIYRVRENYEKIPPERRPFLFFPAFALIFLVLYIGLGVGTTQALSNFADKTVLLLDIQVLLLLPFSILVAALGAYLLVGFPKPQRSFRESLPKVAGRHRPRAFLLTLLLAGIPLTIAVGALLSYIAKVNATSDAFLPEAVILPLALVLGYSLSLGMSVLAWGTPARWRKFEDYTPGLSPRARLSASGAAALAVLLACTIAIGLAGIDIFWGLLVGALLAIGTAILVSGAHRHIAARRGESTLLPDMPDRVKSIVLITTWLVLALVMFSVLTYALPDLVAWNAIIAAAIGLLVAVLLVEQALLQQWAARRKRDKETRKAWAKRRKEALRAAAKGTAETDDTPGKA